MSESAEQQTLIATRPEGQSPNLAANLQEAVGQQANVKHLPLIKIEPIRFQVSQDLSADHLIFISSNAAKQFATSQDAMQLAQKCQCFAVGENTANSVQENLSVNAHYPKKMNAEGLLALPELTNVMGQHWVIVKGQGGRELLRDVLLSRGAQVTELNVYKRVLPDLDEQKVIRQHNAKSTVWLLSSTEAMNNLHRVLGLSQDAEHNTKVIVTSDRLADQASSKGFTILTQAEGAAEKQLIQCAQNYFQSRA